MFLGLGWRSRCLPRTVYADGRFMAVIDARPVFPVPRGWRLLLLLPSSPPPTEQQYGAAGA